MAKHMMIDALHPEEMRVVIADNSQIYEFDFVSATKKQLKGNVYLGKITRVEPSLQAAFVEYGGGKQGFLPFAEIHADYYQIPVSDRRRLMEEQERDDAPEDASPPVADEHAQEAADTEEQPSAAGSEHVDIAAIMPAAIDFEYTAQADDDQAVLEPAAESEQPAAPDYMQSAAPAVELAEPAEEPAEPMEENAAASESMEAKPQAEGEGVESLPTEEEEIAAERPKRNNFHRRYKIQEVIKRGQIVLVQVIKEERGNKGASLTTYLSLAGRYCVLMPNSPKDGGVSRKISDPDTRKRLKQLMAELKLARGMSVIIRTAGIDRTRAEIRRDFDYLVKLWNKIREVTLASTAPALIYEESDLIKRAIRDLYTSDIEDVLVEGDTAYKSARDFMKMLLPSHTPRVKHYKDSMPLFYAYGVEEQLLSMHDPVVKLKSGGYIVINPTEALISIDVNSGRATSERNIEETATKTNLEAAAEIARQLRLRDLAGLIVIDFIDMLEGRNRRSVEKSLKDALKSDRAKIQLGRISPFGLLEMSRQRLRPSISESSSVQCAHCAGRGYVRSGESMSLQIIRSLEKEASSGNWQVLRLIASADTALHLLNHKRALLSSIESRYGVTISVTIDQNMNGSNFTLDKTRRSGERPAQSQQESPSEGRRSRGGRGRGRRNEQSVAPATAADIEIDELVEEPAETQDAAASDEAREPRDGRGRRRRGRRGGRNRNGRNAEQPGGEEPQEALDTQTDEPNGDVAEESPEEGNTERGSRPRRSRGGRNRNSREGGRKRWREEDAGAEPVAAASAMEHYPSEPPPRREPDATALPEFTRSPVTLVSQIEPKPAAPIAPAAPLVVASPTQRPDGEPARKGWWQKIIEME